MVTAVIDPSDANNLQCGPSGLFVGGTQIDDSTCIEVVGDGSNATPYQLDPIIDDDVRNRLTCGDDGLLALPNPLVIGVGGPIFGPAVSASDELAEQFGTVSITTNAGGEALITFPVAFTQTLLTFEFTLVSLPVGVICFEQAADFTTATLQTILLRFVGSVTGDPLIGQLLISWTARGK